MAPFPGDNEQVHQDWLSAARAGAGRARAFALSAEPRPAISRRAVAADIALSIAAAIAALATSGDQPYGQWLVPLLFILDAIPLAWRRVFPLNAFWASLATLFVVGAIGANAGLASFLTIAFVAYSAVVHSRFRGAALISLPVAAGLIMATFADTTPPIPGRATPLLGFLPIMIVGNAVHLWTRRAGDSRAQLRLAQAGHEAATRRVLELERARIASELHDVVTHNVSVMVIQAGAARQILTDSPGDAREALLSVEASGRAALAELRHLLGLLSPAREPAAGYAWTAVDRAHDAASLAPQPGLVDLPGLVDRVADAGLPVDLSVRGTSRGLPPGLDLAAFRVVQESLTNVIKHAGRPQTHVRVGYGADELVVEVSDDGRPFPAAAPAGEAGNGTLGGDRRGLLGLRERVALYGGDLDAGRRPGGGWLVRARIPVDAAEAPAEISPA